MAGCGNTPTSSSAAPCSSAAAGPGIGSCLLESVLLRVPGAARLAVNHVILMVLTDNTAAIVARDERGLYARSAICTHACCIVNLCVEERCASPRVNPAACTQPVPSALVRSGTAFLCPCHGSAFQADGGVLSGPATSALPSLLVHLDGDDVVVDFSRAVDAAARV